MEAADDGTGRVPSEDWRRKRTLHSGSPHTVQCGGAGCGRRNEAEVIRKGRPELVNCANLLELHRESQCTLDNLDFFRTSA